MNTYIYILTMAVTTYLVRAIPLVLLKKPCRSRFLRSFLHYVPAACLAAMTFPAILYATDHLAAGAAGLAVGILLALRNQSLIVVAGACSIAVFLTECLIALI